MKKAYLVLFIFFYASLCLADRFSPQASYQVCFTPAEKCTNLIVDTIHQARKEVLVQAYSFTSAPIVKALIDAHKKGVSVKIIVDKSQIKAHSFSPVKLFNDYQIPTWIDYVPNIAHNKVMIIDQKIVITGSFNFTRAAEEKNAENVIVISDQDLAKKYLRNWHKRVEVSHCLND